MKNILATLGLCRRAGKLLYGFDSVTAQIKENGAAGVVISRELSEKSKKEIKFVCEKYNVPVCETQLGMAELGQIAGKQTGVLAVLDEGLFGSILKNSEKQ